MTEAVFAAAVFAAVALLPHDLNILCVPLFAATVLVFAREQGRLSRLLRHPWFEGLGRRSYSIYLVHAFVAVGLLSAAAVASVLDLPLIGFGEAQPGQKGIVAPPLLADAIIVAFLVLIVQLSKLSYRFVELPGSALGARLLRKAPPG
ncbi:acyltransferase family protein [Sphingomonas baiyangensis]|uniref:Acyltransferase family protein n=1 Tax=Sphingomonas baiyangensis TaxID=2572576 RepID=A0A4U1L332_9SPHN|nr:hypothetical protein [Sphingomonas baiyangensis]TKD50486.1 hypothetical protein FBR43_06710 [Sphingomonas baiyangensis]